MMIPHFLLVADQNFVQLSQRDGILMVFLPFDGERIIVLIYLSAWWQNEKNENDDNDDDEDDNDDKVQAAPS